jgi:hypothetical protein
MKVRPVLTPAMLAVYALVDARADGRCEVVLNGQRCRKAAVDRHHTVKPRRSHTTSDEVMAVCRTHHERCDYPFARGRLQTTPLGDGRFACAIVTAPDKFTYRQQGQA